MLTSGQVTPIGDLINKIRDIEHACKNTHMNIETKVIEVMRKSEGVRVNANPMRRRSDFKRWQGESGWGGAGKEG